MKNICLFISILLISSCATEQLLIDPQMDHSYTYAVSDEATERKNLPVDTVMYNHLVADGMSQECAYNKAYSRTDIQLERVLPSRCHRQYIKFRTVEAYYVGDTLQIALTTTSPMDNKRRSKLLMVKIFDGDYTIELVQNGLLYRDIQHLDGSTSKVKSKSSTVRNQKLVLNNYDFAPGDELVGRLQLTSFVDHPRKGKTHENLSGKFRVIIQDYDASCVTDISGLKD